MQVNKNHIIPMISVTKRKLMEDENSEVRGEIKNTPVILQIWCIPKKKKIPDVEARDSSYSHSPIHYL